MTKRRLARQLWLFGLFKIPLIGFVRPRIIEVSTSGLTVRIPLRRRTRNHVGSMYLAVQSIGADLACGFFAYYLMKLEGIMAPPVFKTMHVEYLKRAEDDVDFICRDADKVQQMVAFLKANPGERVTQKVDVVARCKNEDVALFEMELSLKTKG